MNRLERLNFKLSEIHQRGYKNQINNNREFVEELRAYYQQELISVNSCIVEQLAESYHIKNLTKLLMTLRDENIIFVNLDDIFEVETFRFV